jgi:CBS domain-containing protein/ribosomal protein S27AE
MKEIRTGIKVGDLMTRNFIHVAPETNLKDCAKIMIKKRVGSLIIKEEGKLKGIVTEKDIVWAIVKKSKETFRDIKVKDIMKKKVVTIKPGADIIEAMGRFKKKKIRKLPVVENGKLIGIITTKDILRIDPGLFQMIAETMKIKEEAAKLSRSHIVASRKQSTCEECGEFDILYEDGDQWLCLNCHSKR